VGWWLHLLTFGFILKGMCILSNILGQFAPLPEIEVIKQQGTTGTKDALPYVSIACTGSQWCFYGAFAYLYTGNHGFLVVVYANVIGVGMGFYYNLIYAKCASAEAWATMKLYFSVAGVLYAIQAVCIACRPVEQSLLLCGCFS